MKYFKLLLIILVVAYFPIAANCQIISPPNWYTANGAPAGHATSIAEYNNITYIATYGSGIFAKSSTDASWREVNNGLDCQFVNSIAISPTGTMLVATNYGVYRTTTNTESWTKCNIDTSILLFDFVHSTKSGVLYAGGLNSFFRSTDAGLTWTNVATLNNNRVIQIAEFDENIFFMSTATGMYYTTDKGTSWSALPQVSQPTRGVVIDNNKNIYFVVNYRIAQATFDGIEAFDWAFWDKAQQYNVTCLSLMSNSNRILIGTTMDGLLLATDSNSIAPVGMGGVSITAMPAMNSQHPYVGYDVGIYALDATYNATPLPGLCNLSVGKLYAAPNADIYATLPYGRVSFTTDKGVTWSAAGTNQKGSTLDVIAFAADGKLIAGDEWGLYYSTNKGVTLTTATQHGVMYGIKDIIKRNQSSDLIAVGYASVYKSTNNGEEWSRYNLTFDKALPQGIAESANGVLYLISEDRVFKCSSSDLGAWELVEKPVGLDKIYNIMVIDGGIVISGAREAYKLNESNGVWTELFAKIETESWIRSILKIGTFYFAALQNGDMFLYTELLNLWVKVSDPQFVIQVNNAVLTNNNFVYVATGGRGVLRTNFVFLPAEEQAEAKGLIASPMPASSEFTIHLNDGVASANRIVVTNISGEIMPVGVALDEMNKTACVDCSRLPAGVYCCSVIGTNGTSTEKIIIAR